MKTITLDILYAMDARQDRHLVRDHAGVVMKPPRILSLVERTRWAGLPLQARIEVAERRIAAARYIGWRALEASWQETLDHLRGARPPPPDHPVST